MKHPGSQTFPGTGDHPSRQKTNTAPAKKADQSSEQSEAPRHVVVLCPDWPVVAWGIPLNEPAAVFVANRVVACSPAARVEGVAIGQRRRDAQSRCPDIAVLEQDLDREARLFEPVAAALTDITPRVEITGPGIVGFPTLGPSKFFGGDVAMAKKITPNAGTGIAG